MKLRTTVLTALLLMLPAIRAVADDDPESYHIRAITFTGDTIEGYLRFNLKTGLKNMFSKSGTIHQYIHVADSPEKGSESQRYSASPVREYRYLEPTEDFPEGAVVVSERINSPVPFKPNSNVRGFAEELDRRDCGSILKWNVWESTGGRNSVSRIVPAIGVKFKGARAAYGIKINGRVSLALLLNYLKKAHPEFRQKLIDYYMKGDDAKGHWNELKDNPSTILLVYEEFIKDHDPISDPEENKDLKELTEGKKDKKNHTTEEPTPDEPAE